MKIVVSAGHTLNGRGSGAVGILNESREVRKIGKKVSELLKSCGHNVLYLQIDKADSYKGENYIERVKRSNSWGADLYVEIHLNYYNSKAYGTEIFTWLGESTKVAKGILNNICSLGYRSRGIKNSDDLYVIKHTKCEACLVECFFGDNQKDVSMYNVDSMARAIAQGITGRTIPKPKVNIKKTYSVDYVAKFQEFYNNTTRTKAPLKVDGVFGTKTQNAFNTYGKLLRGEY